MLRSQTHPKRVLGNSNGMGSFKGKCEANLEVPERVGGGAGEDQAKKRKKQHIVWRKSKIRKFDFTNLITINFIFFAGDFNVARHEGDCTDIVMRSSRAKQNINN